MDAANLRAYLSRVADVNARIRDPAAVLAGVAARIGDANGIAVERSGLRLFARVIPMTDDRLTPPPGLAAPELLGHVHAALQATPARRRGGVFITPPSVARGVTDAALTPLLQGRHRASVRRMRVCDPAMGGGAFLIAAARRLAAAGARLPDVVGGCLFGADIDPLAVSVTEAALAMLGWDGGAPPAGLADHLVCGDAVVDEALLRGPFDAVLANPPFLNQLQRSTARSPATLAAVARRFGDSTRGYADGAAVFVLLAAEMVRPGGRVGIILPTSFLATRDVGPVRHKIAGSASVDWLWLAGRRVFDADVSVCALSFELGAAQGGTVRRAAGVDFTTMAAADVGDGRFSTEPSWAFLMADALGVPAVEVASTSVVGDLASATADFRDQFYGLAPVVEEATVGDDDRPRIMTCGLVDPAVSRWGRRATRLAGRRFDRPVVDLRRLAAETTLAPWARQRLVPKVLVATQTRVIEPVVDEHGAWLPSTPVITVQPEADRLWHVAAALASPPLTAVAMRWCAGAGMSADAIKLSAKQVLALPAPTEQDPWDDGAAAFRQASRAGEDGDEEAWRGALHECAAALCRAYRVPEADAGPLLDWWSDRLPRWR